MHGPVSIIAVFIVALVGACLYLIAIGLRNGIRWLLDELRRR